MNAQRIEVARPSMFRFFTRNALLRITVLAAIGFVLSPNALIAQNAPAKPSIEPTRQEAQLAKELARAEANPSQEAERVLQKVLKYQMQQLAAGKITRASIQATYLRAKNAPTRKVIVDVINSEAKGIAFDNDNIYSGQARISSMALLAELDDVLTQGRNPAQPSRAALGTLFNVANGEQFPVYLRAIALHGLERQIGRSWSTWDRSMRNQVGRALMKIANSKPKNAVELESHAWMVRRAYDCLGLIGASVEVNSATEKLADPNLLPSLRLTTASYLCKLDSSKFTPEQKKLYALGLANLLRSQLVDWFEREDDMIKRETGATGGAMTGFAGMDEAMGMDGGGGEEGDDMNMDALMGAMDGEDGAGEEDAKKPIETQTWQTLLARQRVNQVMQAVHRCLDGLPTADTRIRGKTSAKSLADAGLENDLRTKLSELTLALDMLQAFVNDPDTITDVKSLLDVALVPIQDIMDLVLEIPGYASQYPDVSDGEELDMDHTDHGQHAANTDAANPVATPAPPANTVSVEQP